MMNATVSPIDGNAEVVRACFTAFEKKDRALMESILAPDFTFSSPHDDNINRERFFERCWPGSEHVGAFEIEKLFLQGDEAFVQFRMRWRNSDATSRSTDFFTLRDGLITHIDVYFGSEPGATHAEQEIRGVIESWAEAIRKKDVEGVLRHFAENSVRFNLAPPLQTTASGSQNLEEWFATWEGGIGYEIRDQKIHTAGDVAFVHSLNHITGTKLNGEPHADIWFRETMGLRQIDGQWRIVHEHESVPFKMDGTFQAAIDLKPIHNS